MKDDSVKNNILKYLEEHGTATISELLPVSGTTLNHLRVSLSHLKKKREITNVERGIYARLLTPNESGIKNCIFKKADDDINEMAIIDEFVRLKKKFGRNKLKEIIEKFKLLLE